MPIPTISKIRLSSGPFTVILTPDIDRPWPVPIEPKIVTIEGYVLKGLTEELNAFPDPEFLFECQISIEGLNIKSIDAKQSVRFHLKDYKIEYPCDDLARISLEILCTN